MSDLEDSQHLSTADIATSLDAWTGDLSEWINELIEQDTFEAANEPEGSQFRPVDLTALDSRVALLATKLEVACQDTSSQLERTIEDISRNVPRLNFDLQFMREGALALQRELQTIHHKSFGVIGGPVREGSTAKALDQLQFLDSVKRGMDAARAVLQEAENWSSLELETTALLKEASYMKAAQRLSEAAKSMSVFQHTPEYESRRNLMVNLQNQTEAALSAALVSAINAKDVAACRNFHDIFGKIEREVEFRNYYFGARRTSIQDLWSKTEVSDVQGERQTKSSGYSLKFHELLARFLADLLVLVNEERTTIPSVFSTTGDPNSIIALFIRSVFETLAPSLSQRLSGVAAHYGSATLPELIQSFKLIEDFVVKVEKIMEKLSLLKTGGLGPTSPTHEEFGKGHSRHKSKRMSMSRRAPSHKTAGSVAHLLFTGSQDQSWQHPLFEPFLDFQCEYSTLERRLLEDALNSINSTHGSIVEKDAETQAQNLRIKSIDVFASAEESLSRCIDFTHGYGAAGLTQAVDNLFAQFFGQARNELLVPPDRPDIGLADSASVNSQRVFEGELLSQEELGSFQLALNLLNSSRGLQEKLDSLEGRYKHEISKVAQTLHQSSTYPGGHYIEGTGRAEAELLAQSTLNSMALTELLEALEPTSTLPPTAGLGGNFTITSGSAVRSDPSTPMFRGPPVLKGSYKVLKDFSRAIQNFLQELILSPLISHLSTYPKLSAWTSTEQSANKTKPYEFSIPTFSLSATPVMQRVCDGLMALPRMFEDYAGDDEALAFSLATLPYVERDSAIKEYLDWSTQTQPVSSEREVHSSPRTKRLSISSPSFHRLTLPGAQSLGIVKPPVLTAEAISSAWLSSITYGLLAHLTKSVLPQIHTLSSLGAAQLAYDLGDLCNISRALNAEWEDLDRWRECCEIADEDGRRRWLSVQGAVASTQGSPATTEIDGDSIFRLVARIRGWVA